MLNLLYPLRRRAAATCLVLLGTFLSGLMLTVPVAGAQDGAEHKQISEDAAVSMVREQTDGKVVRVDRERNGDSLVYRIRVLSPDGRLREYRVDSATGSIY